MSIAKQYVERDEQGTFRVGRLGVSLDSVVIAFQQGHPAESIQQQYPALSLEEVYGAIAFYLANRKDVHEYFARQEQRWDEMRQRIEQNPSPVVARMRATRGLGAPYAAGTASGGVTPR